MSTRLWGSIYQHFLCYQHTSFFQLDPGRGSQSEFSTSFCSRENDFSFHQIYNYLSDFGRQDSAPTAQKKKEKNNASNCQLIVNTSLGDIGEARIEQFLVEAAEEVVDKAHSPKASDEEPSDSTSPIRMEPTKTVTKTLRAKLSSKMAVIKDNSEGESSASDSSPDTASCSDLIRVKKRNIQNPKLRNAKITQLLLLPRIRGPNLVIL